jgi:tRNA threonylcarbamoyladenosine biosynthesis protein TsaB
MALLLSLETSTSVCSAAVHDGDRLLAVAELHREQSHAAKLAVLVENVLKLADTNDADLKAIAVSSGPGSYTGLRIGVSTAKGLAYALSIPLISVETLELMAHQIQSFVHEASVMCPMIDARRMEVYCLLWSQGAVVEPVSAKIIEAGSFAAALDKGPIVFFGNGSDKCRALINHPNATFLPGIVPSASGMGTMAWRKFQANEVEDVALFEPHYLKEFRILKRADPGQVTTNESQPK